MTRFTTRTAVRCPSSQSARRLSQYLRAHGNADGDVVRLDLGAGSTTSVIATFTPAASATATIPALSVSWVAEGHGPYPAFSGILALEPEDDAESFALRLTGGYVPPFGSAGATFDAVLGHRFAKATVARLLLRIAEAIEEQVDADAHRPPAASVRPGP